MQMEIQEQRHGDFITIAPAGDLDANSSVMLDEKLLAMLKAGDVRAHVDGSQISYISSAGLGVFVSHLEEFRQAGGSLVISGLRPNVKDVFALLGLDQLLTIVDDFDSAAQILRQA